VPLLVRVPRVAASTVSTPIGLQALHGLLLALAGLPLTGDDVDLLGLVGVANVGPGPGFAGFDAQQWSFVHDRYRLLHAPRQQWSELYDVVADPRELHNLARARPRLAHELRARLLSIVHERDTLLSARR
jgi:hypothetical protein